MRRGHRTGNHIGQIVAAGILLLLVAAGSGCQRSTVSPSPLVSPLASPLHVSPTELPTEIVATPEVAAKLLFHSNRSGQYDIYELNLATGQVVQLTDAAEHDLEPALSPDGTLIAFAKARLDMSGQDIWVMNADGSNPHLLASVGAGIATSPDWSPDGSQIAFYATQASQFHLFVVPASGGDVTELAYGGKNDMMPDWSPDGEKILFASDRSGQSDLYVMRPDGSGLEQLTDTGANEWRPRWSPDGRHIVFQGNQGAWSENWNLYLLDVETGEIEQLTDGELDSSMPAWSGDGGTIFFAQGSVVQTTDGQTRVRSGLWALDLQDRSVGELATSAQADDAYPSWCP